MHEGWFYLHVELLDLKTCFDLYKENLQKKKLIEYLLKSSSGSGNFLKHDVPNAAGYLLQLLQIQPLKDATWHGVQGFPGPQSPHTPPFPSTNPETLTGARLSDGSNWDNGHQDLGEKAASHTQALAFYSGGL